MIKVTEGHHNRYTLRIDVVEMNMLLKIAKCYGISKASALEACISKGFDMYIAHMVEIAEYEKRKRDNQEGGG